MATESQSGQHDKSSWTRYKVTIGLVTFLCLIYSGCALHCYHCLERPKSTEKHLACAYFDMSPKYHKECTHSTFCMKRTSLYQLHNGTFITMYVHKCAEQSHKTMVQDKNGDWSWANLLKLDLYNEGCHPHRGSPTTDTSHCYCTSDFCNTSTSLPKIYENRLLSFLFLFYLFQNIYLFANT